MRKATKIERLQNVIRVVKAVPPRNFDLADWMQDCGTVGCAIGWCASDPFFTRRGLKLNRRGKAPVFRGFVGFDAIREFFGMHPDQAEELFLACEYPDPCQSGAKGKKAVVKRITDLISEIEAA